MDTEVDKSCTCVHDVQKRGLLILTYKKKLWSVRAKTLTFFVCTWTLGKIAHLPMLSLVISFLYLAQSMPLKSNGELHMLNLKF